MAAKKSKKGAKTNRMQGITKNLKSGVSPRSINSNTMTPKTQSAADRDLGKLLGR